MCSTALRRTSNWSAEFEDETYTVTANAASGGTIELSADTVSAGGSITVTVKPDEGYVLKSLTVNGQAVAVKADGTYVIENIFADQTVAAEFEKKQDTSVPTVPVPRQILPPVQKPAAEAR